jgi:hypothetical protein
VTLSDETKRFYRFGGVAFILGGVLFLAKSGLDFAAGPPPSNGVEILAWVKSEQLALSLASEILFFAAMALVPAVTALYHSLATTEWAKAATGCGIFAVAIPVIAMLLIIQGRLVYPVYGIHVTSPAVAEHVVAEFYGGLHAVGELMGFATLILSLAMMRGVYGRGIAYLGFLTGALDIVGAYPYIIGPSLTLVCQVCFAAWFVAVGSKLYGTR